MDEKKNRPDETGGVRVSLMGKALLLAIDTGLVKFDKKKGSYDIGPFTKFWGVFSEAMKKALEKNDDL